MLVQPGEGLLPCGEGMFQFVVVASLESVSQGDAGMESPLEEIPAIDKWFWGMWPLGFLPPFLDQLSMCVQVSP